jgi:transcriptional antiterminator NusG
MNDELLSTTDDLGTDDIDVEVDAAPEAEVAFDLTADAGALVDDADIGEVIDDPWTRPGKWYVVHTQSGYEKKVSANLAARIQSMNMEDRIYETVIPMEDVEEFKNGRKQTVQKKVFPGYILVRCQMDDESWYCIRNTPGVTGSAVEARSADLPRRQGRRHRRPARPQEAQARVRDRRERPREGRPLRRLHRHDRRDQRRSSEAQGPGEHLRS